MRVCLSATHNCYTQWKRKHVVVGSFPSSSSGHFRSRAHLLGRGHARRPVWLWLWAGLEGSLAAPGRTWIAGSSYCYVCSNGPGGPARRGEGRASKDPPIPTPTIHYVVLSGRCVVGRDGREKSRKAKTDGVTGSSCSMYCIILLGLS